jgi:predicted thioesterase
MRPGPPRGASATIELPVADDRVAAAAPAVAPTLSGPGLAAAAEAACHELFDAHLEKGDVATIASLDLQLRAPVPLGATLEITASVADVRPTGLVCEILARRNGVIVARGSVEHRVLAEDELAAEVAAQRPLAG